MLTDARFKFALECLKKCIMMEPKTNFFFSPHLLYHSLLLAYFGALYDLEFTLGQILYIPDSTSKRTVEEYYKNGGVNDFCYIKNGSENSYTCRIYYKIIIDSSKGLFIDTLNLHAATNAVKECNFKIAPYLVRDFINNIVTCTTQNCIKNLLPPFSIDEDTEIIMLNTIYFEGQFDQDYNVEVHNDDKDIGILAKHINYSFDQLDVIITEVPCKENMISTFYFYPSYQSELENNLIEVQKVIKLIEQLTTEEGSRELRKLLDNGIQEMSMVFPFVISNTTIECDVPICKLLDMLGIPDFTPDLSTAELHDYSESVKLGDVMHRVSVNLKDNNIMASASNVMFTYNMCKHEQKMPEIVNVKFPCICLVYDRSHHNILFCGMLWES
ncbi:Serpin B3 [Trachymyrmex septentrionalis]|uniref:Serpin B3 n=1 Tax=Trachymyrmex septentrionalis TaxID=34720 RepID=A0A151JW12_9HYME|nr:PREDICTED: serpin B4-like [Trachymyrmex septentrionalis]KYN38161.1 Serpin B3 [Trachymyrmex septentrionalis]